jgi:hypothetical protein
MTAGDSMAWVPPPPALPVGGQFAGPRRSGSIPFQDPDTIPVGNRLVLSFG